MRYALIAFIIVMGIFAGYYVRLDQKGLELITKLQQKEAVTTLPSLPQFGPSQKTEEKTGSTAGIVAGIQTEKLQNLGESVKQAGSVLGRTVSTILTEQKESQEKQIQIESLAGQISKQVESIPSSLLNQAKVAYCQQVLIEATKSATSQ